MKLPKSRTDNIVVQNLNDEILIYDLLIDKALCLNDTSAKVFNACDGKTTFAELQNKFRMTDEIIYLSLDELKKNNLIAEEYASPFDGINRRDAIRKVGAASLIALPLISSLIAPTAAHAQSQINSGTCNTGSTCGCIGKSFNGAETCNSPGCSGTSPTCACRNVRGCNPGGNQCVGTCSS